jgi:sigma-B regulation protein RsbU (phosphoserine phosphatase)
MNPIEPLAAALLVVDDNEDNRYTLGQRLKRIGYTNVAFATNGREALDALRSREFDLMLLDVMMPEMNGYEVLEQLRADERLRHLPVVMISAVDQIESVIRCIELGAEDYLQKPFNPTLLKARVGASLDKKRLRDEVVTHLERVEADLRRAREIQLEMVPAEFPAAPPPAHLDVHAALHPAREIGGDLYDYFYSDPETLCIAIADVAGKGTPAALFMARTKTLVRMVATLLPGAGSSQRPRPDEVVARVNSELCRDNASLMFVTLFFGMLDLPSRTLTYCNAGHNPPYLMGAGGSVVAFHEGRGQPLGIRADARCSSASRPLAPGDCLYLFTDGITEATDGEGRLFEEHRLEAHLKEMSGAPVREVVERSIARVREFAGNTPQSDDIAAMAIRLVR